MSKISSNVACSKDGVSEYHPRKLNSLGIKFGVDLAAACVASTFLTPSITIIDRSIVMNTNGFMTLTQALKDGVKQLICNPLRTAIGRDYRIVWGVYTATYLAANSTISICEYFNVSADIPKLATTSAVNIYTCVRKDIKFAQMFSNPNIPIASSTPKRFPLLSSALFVVRDCMTIGASFNAPPYVAQYIRGLKTLEPKTQSVPAANRTQVSAGSNAFEALSRLRVYLSSEGVAKCVAQIVCPMSIQFLTVPIHLFALDRYNNPTNTASTRVGIIKSKYFISLAARVVRMVPAFGVGGIVNTKAKEYFISFTERLKLV